MGALISIGFSIFVLLMMYAFGLYAARNFRWVAFSLLWGGLTFGLCFLLERQAARAGLNLAATTILALPVLQQALTALGVYGAVRWEKFDNLVDGAVYGFANGLGYAGAQAVSFYASDPTLTLQRGLEILAATLVLAVACGVVGVAATQFYFRHRKRRFVALFGAVGASVGYLALFHFLAALNVGGYVLPLSFGVGGVTLIGLYITGQLRGALIRLGVEKRRADSLLDIVIPIGVQLTYEKNLQKLLQDALNEAKKFCSADGGALYLRKENVLELAALRVDSLNVDWNGEGEAPAEFPPLKLYKEDGKPNHRHPVAYAALTGKTVNIEDSYENRQFDFSDARAFDEKYNYASVSLLTIPLKSSSGEALGALQLANPLDSSGKRLVSFDANLQQLMESFSSLAAAALEGYVQEQALRSEIQQLRIEIDQAKRRQQVSEITDTSYFRGLQKKAKEMRQRTNPEKKAAAPDADTLPPQETDPKP